MVARYSAGAPACADAARGETSQTALPRTWVKERGTRWFEFPLVEVLLLAGKLGLLLLPFLRLLLGGLLGCFLSALGHLCFPLSANLFALEQEQVRARNECKHESHI